MKKEMNTFVFLPDGFPTKLHAASVIGIYESGKA
jgi:hypothetical protein